MTDLRVRLERLGERAAPRTDAFERLERRRRRKERNRRVGAGALALALVAGGSLAAVTAFRGEGATVGGAETEEGFFALWPEQTRGAAEVAQEQVASGQTDLGWHLDPEGTAAVFAREVLLIEDFTIDGMTAIDTAIDQRPGPVEVEIATPPPPCPSPPEGESISCGPSVFRVTLERLLDRDGIWSITRIESPGLELPMAAGEVVSSGTWIRVPTSLPDGGKVSMGIQFLSACEREGVDDNVVVANGVLELYVPAVPKACIGYVYAALPPTPPGAVATGSFLFSDAPARPSIGYVIRAISAVPVRFVNDTPTAVAVLACDGTGTISPETSAVIAQADGVHIAVTNAGEDPATFSVGDVGGHGVDPGQRKERVWQLPPGDVTVSCGVISDAGTRVASSASLSIVDPNGYYVPDALDCSNIVGMSPEYAEGWLGYQGDPVEAAHVLLTGLLADDVVERAGYPESSEPIVRIVRDGAVVGRVRLFSDQQGGWLLGALDRCDEPGISFGWGDEATKPFPRGWFEWCPAPPFSEPGPRWRERASAAAVRFVEASTADDDRAVSELLDPSVPPGTEFPEVVIAEGTQPVVGGADARGGPLVDFGCGRDVDAYTVAVTIDDGTESASADFTVFLVLRADGWKVWGVY